MSFCYASRMTLHVLQLFLNCVDQMSIRLGYAFDGMNASEDYLGEVFLARDFHACKDVGFAPACIDQFDFIDFF